MPFNMKECILSAEGHLTCLRVSGQYTLPFNIQVNIWVNIQVNIQVNIRVNIQVSIQE